VNIVTNLFANLHNVWFNLRQREEGQTMAEYAVVLAVLVVVTAAAFELLGNGITGAINRAIGELS
jgi:Flp pilus assembly pilin Flp